MSDSKPFKITGAIRHLEGGRFVFIGEHPHDPTTWCVGFRSAAGRILRFALSDEAMRAMIELVQFYPPAELVPFPPDLTAGKNTEARWREIEVVREELKATVFALDQDTDETKT